MEFSENDIISEIPSGDPGTSSSTEIAKTKLNHNAFKQTTNHIEVTIPPQPAENNATTSSSPAPE